MRVLSALGQMHGGPDFENITWQDINADQVVQLLAKGQKKPPVGPSRTGGVSGG